MLSRPLCSPLLLVESITAIPRQYSVQVSLNCSVYRLQQLQKFISSFLSFTVRTSLHDTSATVSNSSASNPNSPQFQVSHSPIQTDFLSLPLYQKSRTFEKPASEGANEDETDSDPLAITTTKSMLDDAEMLLVLNKSR